MISVFPEKSRELFEEHTEFLADEDTIGVKSGINSVDSYLLPLQATDLGFVIARPGMGKTALMSHYSFEASKLHKNLASIYGPPIFISLEMPVEALMVRSVAHYSGIDSKFILTGKSAVDWDLVKDEARKMVEEFPVIYIGNSLYSTGKERGQGYIEVIEKQLNDTIDKLGISPSLICVDYIQRISSTKGGQDRRLMMNEFVERFKDWATYFKTPFLVGSQALRSVDERPFPIPRVRDGKETGGIEEAADWVVSGMRPSRYWKVGEPVPKSSQIVTEDLYFLSVLKQRNGDAGRGFWIQFEPTVGKFDELTNL